MRGGPAAGTAVLGLALLAASGCERREPAATAATAPAAPTLDAAANATYPTDHTAAGTLRLVAGHYEDSDLVTADLDPLSVTGELDGDPASTERVVLLTTGTGGSGLFRDLYVLRAPAAGAPASAPARVSAPAFLGDRVVVNDLRIEHGEIVTDLVVQGEKDPLCCPTLAVTYRFRLNGDALTEITGQQRVFLKD